MCDAESLTFSKPASPYVAPRFSLLSAIKAIKMRPNGDVVYLDRRYKKKALCSNRKERENVDEAGKKKLKGFVVKSLEVYIHEIQTRKAHSSSHIQQRPD